MNCVEFALHYDFRIFFNIQMQQFYWLVARSFRGRYWWGQLNPLFRCLNVIDFIFY